MSGRTFQVFTRQVLAMPMEGGWVIAEKFTSATVHGNEVTNVISCVVIIVNYSKVQS